MAPRWNFRLLQKSEQNRAPIEGEFFRSVDALVREAVQNSLDAALERVSGDSGQPVRLRIALRTGGEMLPAPRTEFWLGGLAPHLLASDLVEEITPWKRSIPFITIEDFGTRGLLGPTGASRRAEVPDNEDADFFYFWRNVGYSGKAGNQRGSWGLGKAVFPASSTFRSILGWTIRSTDKASLLMGQSVLALHRLKGDDARERDAYGFFAEFTDPADKDFAVPVVDSALIAAFRKDFRLARVDHPGFSLVVPAPFDELVNAKAAETLALSVLRHYTFPILAGQLVVEVLWGEGKTLTIDKERLPFVFGEIDWEQQPEDEQKRLKAIVDLTEWLLSHQETAVVLAREDSIKAEWSEYSIPRLSELQAAFAERTPIAVRVPIVVRRKGAEKEHASFLCALRQGEDLPGAAVHYIRQGLTISEVPSPSLPGLVGLVVVDDPPLARLLRDAENPAHTKWGKREERLKKHWIGGGDRVDLVSSAPAYLWRELTGAPQAVDVNFLTEFFPEPDVDSKILHIAGGGRKKGRKPKVTIPIPPPLPRPLKLSPLAGGFSLTRVAGVAAPAELVRVEVAFDVDSGNPFSAWEEYDFQFGAAGLELKVEGGELKSAEGNVILARLGEGFHMTASGFPESRDLVVRYRWLPEEDQ